MFLGLPAQRRGRSSVPPKVEPNCDGSVGRKAMTQLELQHNVAVCVRATRGCGMTEERSAADLRDESTVPGSSSAPSTDIAWTDLPKDETPAQPEGPAGVRTRGASLSPQSRDRIASQLRTMYAAVANQPVPDRFAELIARLDTADRDS